jgi:hypothetical protein
MEVVSNLVISSFLLSMSGEIPLSDVGSNPGLSCTPAWFPVIAINPDFVIDRDSETEPVELL